MNRMMTINLLGDINRAGEQPVDEGKSLLAIANEDAGGMADEKNLFLTQVGGPLGPFVEGEDLRKSLEEYKESLIIPTIMFLSDRFCPVDYSRFLLKYVKLEMRVQSEELDILADLMEEISSGKTRKYTFEELEREMGESSSDSVVSRVKKNIAYLMSRFGKVFREHFEDKRCLAGICYRLFPAQCVNACPAGIDIPGYIALMYQGQDRDAYRLMRKENPLSFICGKICARPCEARCRRGEIEQTVGVRALKHYAASMALSNPGGEEKKSEPNGKSVGIIGAGPAGLSAAYYLAKTGYKVDLFEKHSVTGGMLAMGVPSYRLSQESIDKEVALIEKLGVNIRCNTEIGKDVSFRDIRNQYDSTLLATGCHIPNLFSDHLENLESAIGFLREVKLEGRKSVGGKVVVIGGGDVAMDAARTALRLGAEKVRIVSLESYKQMPANDEEKEEAIAEGIAFHNGYGTKVILEEDNRARGITLQKCTSLFDINNKFSPVYDGEDTLELDCDHIILAIGQRADISYLDSSVEQLPNGRLKVDSNQRTSAAGLYATGDMNGPGSAIKAIAEGKKAAVEIDAYLGGEGLYDDGEIEIPHYQNHYSLWDREGEHESVELYEQGCSGDCGKAFEENRRIYSEEEARREALRCMRCDRNSRQ